MGYLEYDAEHMEDIARSYLRCAAIVEEIILIAKRLDSEFELLYDGQAKENIIPEIISKLVEHLELLELCYSNAGLYVTNSKNIMMQLDATMSGYMTKV